MLTIVHGVLSESVGLLHQMSPYLILGFFFAGLLHTFISLDLIARHLGKNNVASVIKSVALGIPLPLCSCGVIPAAITLKERGATRGSIVSFLIATPITGVDSILATYSLMGLAFAIFRVIASALTAIVAGILTNILAPSRETTIETPITSECCERSSHKNKKRVTVLFHYAFVELLGDIWKSLVVGILIAGMISWFAPDAFIQKYLGNSWQAMLVMFAVGMPMYVCSTGSIPIATSLMMKGMSPGAALVFLLAGPATNAVTITVVSKEIGKKATILYVMTIAVMSVLLGMLLNIVWDSLGIVAPKILMPMSMLPVWVGVISSIVLVLLIIFNVVSKWTKKN